MISKEYIDQLNTALASACPLMLQDSEAVKAISEKIAKFHAEIGYPPNESQVIAWAVPFEQSLLQKKEAAEAEAKDKARQRQEKADARKKERAYDRQPSPITRAEANAELRKLNESQPTPERFVPAKDYSQREIDAMSEAEIQQKLYGRDVGEPLNQSKPAHELDEVRKKRILHSTNKGGSQADKQMRAALRRQIREGLL
jgi:hypothetical protein